MATKGDVIPYSMITNKSNRVIIELVINDMNDSIIVYELNTNNY